MLKRLASLILLAVVSLVSLAYGAEPTKAKFAMALDRLPVAQAVMFVHDQCSKRGLVVDSSLNRSEETLTLKTGPVTCGEAVSLLRDSLAPLGVQIEEHGSYDVLRYVVVDDRKDWRQVIFAPRFRDASELADQTLIAVRKGSYAHQRKAGMVAPPEGAGASQVADTGSNGASVLMKNVDKLVFFGPPGEADAVESLLARLDVPAPQVEIRAGIYEYQTGGSEGSSVSAVVSLLGGKFGLDVNGGVVGGSALKLKVPSLDAVLQLLDSDSRFRYVARPKVLARDGEPVHFFAGEDQRVTGSVVLDRNGNQVQSRETLSAGVTLEATPRIHRDVVDLSLYQSVSNFVSGAAGDPSILKRDLRSRLLMQPGFVYVVGGLQSSRKTSGWQRFFGFAIGASEDRSEVEVLLLLSVTPDPQPI